jgi:transposase InsO family protein
VLSLGRTGQCRDNALAESFFVSLKGESTDLQAWPVRAAARRAIVDYIGLVQRNSRAQQPYLGSLRRRSSLFA